MEDSKHANYITQKVFSKKIPKSRSQIPNKSNFSVIPNKIMFSPTDMRNSNLIEGTLKKSVINSYSQNSVELFVKK